MSNSKVWSLTLMIAVGFGAAPLHAQQKMSLSDAVKMALASDDPYLTEPAERARALKAQSVAEGQLADPKVNLAFANWPTDSFSYSQEAMTQLKVGVSQAFPRGDTRRLKRERRQFEANAFKDQQARRQLDVILDTRLAWLELYFQQAAVEKVSSSRQAITELISVIQSNFAAGKNKSQDIFRAEMELALLEDRLISLDQKSELARARLARRTGAEQAIEVSGKPVLRYPADVSVILELLQQHPHIESKRKQLLAADKGVSLAGEQYKPGWAVSVGYGARGGGRADFASVGVTLDVPLFKKNRQDQQLTAAKHSRQAQQMSLNASLLDMEKRLTGVYAVWSRLKERIALYERVVRERAKETAEASLSSYQSGVTDFPELVRARLAELDIELKLLNLEQERLKAQAELLFLEGEEDA